MSNNSVFELIENSGDEFYPIGIFETYQEAMDEIDECDKNKSSVYSYAEDSEHIAICERTFGLSYGGKEVYSCIRERVFDTPSDWKRTKVEIDVYDKSSDM